MKRLEMQPPGSGWKEWLFGAQGHLVFFGVLVALTLFLSLRDFYSYQFGFTPDSAEYTLLAHSLLQGPSYGLTHTPGEPEPTHFPFGYPLLIIPFVLLAPRDFLLPQWLSLLATLTSGAILFWGWRRLVPMYSDRWRYAVTAMFLLAPLTLSHTRFILSEPIFMAFVLLSLWFAAALRQSPNQTRLWLGLAIATFFMVLTRSVGGLFLACVLIYLWFTLRGRALRGTLQLFATMGLMFAIVLVLTPVKVGDLIPETYVEQLIAYGPINPIVNPRNPTPRPNPQATPTSTTIGSATQPPSDPVEFAPGVVLDTYYIQIHLNQDLTRVVWLFGGGMWQSILARSPITRWILFLPGAACLFLLAVGNLVWLKTAWRARRLRISLFQVVALVYLPIAFIWRGGGERLFYPIQPQIYLALVTGILLVLKTLVAPVTRFSQSLTREQTVKWGSALCAVLVVGWLALAVVRDWTLSSSYAIWGDLNQRTDPILQSTPPDAILLTDWPVLDYLITDRRTVTLPQGIVTNADLQALLQEQHINYIVIATDETFTKSGIAPFEIRFEKIKKLLPAMLFSGALVRVESTPFPLQILRVVP